MIKTMRLLQKILVMLIVIEEYIQTDDDDAYNGISFIDTLLASSSTSLMLLVDRCWMCSQLHLLILFGHSETAEKGYHLVNFFPFTLNVWSLFTHVIITGPHQHS